LAWALLRAPPGRGRLALIGAVALPLSVSLAALPAASAAKVDPELGAAADYLVRASAPSDPIVTVVGFDIVKLQDANKGRNRLLGFSANPFDEKERAGPALAEWSTRPGALWLVTRALDANDPTDAVEGWLATHAYFAGDR